MGTQIPPEGQPLENQPPQSPAPTGPTASELMQALNESKELNRLILQQLDNVQNRQVQREPEPEFDTSNLLNDPNALASFIRKTVTDSINPLAQSVAQTQRVQIIDNIVQQAKNTSGYEDVKDFEGLFRASLSSMNDLNLGTIQTAYYHAKGQFASQPKGIKPNEPTPINRQPNNIPVHLQPSGVVLPSNDGNLPKLRQLNEHEERLRKEQGFSVHKWLFRLKEIDKATFDAYETKAKGGK